MDVYFLTQLKIKIKSEEVYWLRNSLVFLEDLLMENYFYRDKK